MTDEHFLPYCNKLVQLHLVLVTDIQCHIVAFRRAINHAVLKVLARLRDLDLRLLFHVVVEVDVDRCKKFRRYGQEVDRLLSAHRARAQVRRQ